MNQQPEWEIRPSRPPIGHLSHFALTVLSCGMWLPIWIIMTVIDWCRPPRTTVAYRKYNHHQ